LLLIAASGRSPVRKGIAQVTDHTKDNLVLFPKTLDYYQIQLTQMLESERYAEAKALLLFLLQCGGEAERHHTEWQALLGWLNAAFPGGASDGFSALPGPDAADDWTEEEWAREQAEDRSSKDPAYVPRLLRSLSETDDPEQLLLIIGQLLHLKHPDIAPALREWLMGTERHPTLQFKALQALSKQEATGAAIVRRDGQTLELEIDGIPLAYSDFPPAVHTIAWQVRQAAEVSDPTLAYFAEEMWKECVQAAYGTPIYGTMVAGDAGSTDVWAAALHQILLEKLHDRTQDDEIREHYGITDELRFRYEQALRWLRQYAVEPGPG